MDHAEVTKKTCNIQSGKVFVIVVPSVQQTSPPYPGMLPPGTLPSVSRKLVGNARKAPNRHTDFKQDPGKCIVQCWQLKSDPEHILAASIFVVLQSRVGSLRCELRGRISVDSTVPPTSRCCLCLCIMFSSVIHNIPFRTCFRDDNGSMLDCIFGCLLQSWWTRTNGSTQH